MIQVKLEGNGGLTDNYRWTQTLQELAVFVPIPSNMRARDLVVDFQQKKLKVPYIKLEGHNYIYIIYRP